MEVAQTVVRRAAGEGLALDLGHTPPSSIVDH